MLLLRLHGEGRHPLQYALQDRLAVVLPRLAPLALLPRFALLLLLARRRLINQHRYREGQLDLRPAQLGL